MLVGLAETVARRCDEAATDGWSAHETSSGRLWHGSSWADRLTAEAEGVGAPSAVDAERSLDAVVALFDLAARSRRAVAAGQTSRTFLAEVGAQEIPAGTLADAGVRGHGVRVMTAHRSKGLEWDVVVVAGVQAESWPDLRRRGSVLERRPARTRRSPRRR